MQHVYSLVPALDMCFCGCYNSAVVLAGPWLAPFAVSLCCNKIDTPMNFAARASTRSPRQESEVYMAGIALLHSLKQDLHVCTLPPVVPAKVLNSHHILQEVKSKCALA